MSLLWKHREQRLDVRYDKKDGGYVAGVSEVRGTDRIPWLGWLPYSKLMTTSRIALFATRFTMC